jgi:hypothetical protein
MLVRKSIVFNTADPDQNDLVKHAELRTIVGVMLAVGSVGAEAQKKKEEGK